MNSNANDMLKNEFAKARETPEPSSVMYKERGGCLTVFLVWIIASAAYYLFTTIPGLLNTNVDKVANALNTTSFAALAPYIVPITVASVVLNIAILVFAVAMWRWKKWGYYGLLALNVALAIIMLMLGNIFGVVGAILNVAVLNAVYGSRIEMFE
jgi:hypothetical protein